MSEPSPYRETCAKLLALVVLEKGPKESTRIRLVQVVYRSCIYIFQLQKLFKGVKEGSPYKSLKREESFIIYPRTSGSACNGDSGGPYLCNIGGVWKQFGIAG